MQTNKWLCEGVGEALILDPEGTVGEDAVDMDKSFSIHRRKRKLQGAKSMTLV